MNDWKKVKRSQARHGRKEAHQLCRDRRGRNVKVKVLFGEAGPHDLQVAAIPDWDSADGEGYMNEVLRALELFSGLRRASTGQARPLEQEIISGGFLLIFIARPSGKSPIE